MSQRTQMRLHAITGSIPAIDSVSSSPLAPSAIDAANMLDVMGQFAGAIKRITGAETFTGQATGQFSHALTGSHGLKLQGDLDVDAPADFQGAVNLQSTLTVAGAIDANSSADFQGALNLQSTLTVAGAIDANSSADFQGAVNLQSTLTVAGAVDINAAADIQGALNLQSTLTVAGAVDINAAADIQGAAQFQSTINVDGIATLASAVVEDLTPGRVVYVGNGDALVDSTKMTFADGVLTVSGSTISKDVAVAQDLQVTRDMSARSGSFSGDLTVSGDLFINGTTTTINSTVVSVDDKNLELGAVETPSDITADGGGIILKGGTDKSILWSNTSGAWELSDDVLPSTHNEYDLGASSKRWQDLYLAGAADIDGNVDVAGTLAVSGTLTVTGGTAFNGLVDVNAGLSASFIKIDTDVATRLYIVDTDGSMKDEVKLRFDGSELLVDAHLEVSGAADLKSSLAVAGAADIDGALDVGGASDLQGAVRMYSTVRVDGAADLKSTLLVSGAADFLSTMDIVGAVQMDSTLSVDGQATFSLAINLDQAADQSILKTGGDLHMSASADIRLQAGGDFKLVDQYRVASTWSDAEGIKLAASAAEWSNFKATFGGEVSLLAALTGGGAGGKFVEAVDYSGTIISGSLLAGADGSSDFSVKWPTIVEPRVLKTDVFVNGQLMISGSGMDYLVDGAGNVTFSFGLVPDDMVVVKVG